MPKERILLTALQVEFVYSRALKKYRKALLSKTINGPPPVYKENETGNHHPENTQRVSRTKHLRDTMINK